MDSRPLLISNATVFDATGGPARPNTSILIEEGRIAAVTPAAGQGTHDGATLIDGTGKFVIPGLIDMHVHVELSGGEDALPAWLGTGVTSVRDVGGAPANLIPLRDAINAGTKTGPRVFTYGPLLDGTPPIFGAAAGALAPRGGIDPGSLTWTIADAATAEQAVDELIARGVDGFKLYAGLRPDLVRAFLERIDGRLPVTGHLSRTWASEAIEMGINCLEHVHATIYQDVVPPEFRHPREEGNGFIPNYWTWLNTGWANADLGADYVKRFVELLVSRGVALSPTTVLITGGMATREALDEPGLKYTPRGLTQRRAAQMEQARRLREEAEKAGRPLPPPMALEGADAETGQRARAKQLEFLKMVYEAGGTVVPSTDVGAAPNQVPGFSLHRELALFAEAGIPNAAVIELATRHAARVLRKDDELGTLAPGKRADLLLLTKDPLADIHNTRAIEAVVKDGVTYAPQPLLERAVAGG